MMEVFADLFNDLTGWLTIAILVFVISMMVYFANMIISKAKGDGG